ncbi:MAG: hypothetical protein EZS28_044028, partial [Streblomastix strix]
MLVQGVESCKTTRAYIRLSRDVYSELRLQKLRHRERGSGTRQNRMTTSVQAFSQDELADGQPYMMIGRNIAHILDAHALDHPFTRHTLDTSLSHSPDSNSVALELRIQPTLLHSLEDCNQTQTYQTRPHFKAPKHSKPTFKNTAHTNHTFLRVGVVSVVLEQQMPTLLNTYRTEVFSVLVSLDDSPVGDGDSSAAAFQAVVAGDGEGEVDVGAGEAGSESLTHF